MWQHCSTIISNSGFMASGKQTMTDCIVVALFCSVFLVKSTSVLCDGSVETNDIVTKDRRKEDPCTTDCLNKVSVHTNSIVTADSCSRGCRFFTLAQLIGKKQNDGQMFIAEACKAMCQESYGRSGSDTSSCNTGCESSTIQSLQIPIVAEVSWSWFIDSGNSMQILQGEFAEPDDVLTDPSLRSQIARVETLRIPEIRLRTMPLLQDKSVQMEGGPALCTGISLRGIQSCLVWSLLLLLTLVGLWSCVGEVRDHQAAISPPLLPLK